VLGSPSGLGASLVAIRHPGVDSATTAPRLADALGISLYDARRRLLGGGPRLVASFADAGAAARTVGALEEAGFAAVVVPLGRGDEPLVAHGFAFEADGLRVVPRSGPEVALGFDRIRLFVRGTRIVAETHTEVSRERRFSPGRALLSGGLVLTKTVATTRAEAVETREGFLLACGGDGPDVLFRETELVYDGFGPERQSTRVANFVHLVSLLRHAAPSARFDDCLLTRAGQASALGGLLEPEEHLDAAIAVVKRAALAA